MPLSTNHSLTANQKAIWLEQQIYPDSAIYNIGGYAAVEGSIDFQILTKAISQFIEETDAMRTHIKIVDHAPFQEFLSELNYTVDELDFSNHDEPVSAALDWMKSDFNIAFDTSAAPLFKTALVKVSNDHYWWYNKFHHLIIDGFGLALFTHGVADQYNSLLTKTPIASDKVFSYRDFIAFDNNYTNSDDFQADKAFWATQFDTTPSALLAPKYGNYQPGVAPKKGIKISRDIYDRIASLCSENKVSEFHCFLALIYTYFSKVHEKRDWAIGLPILNRSNFVQKKTVGLFTGISPLRLNIDPSESLLDLMFTIKAELRKNYRHQRFPIDEIVRTMKQSGGISHNLVDVTFSYEKHTYGMQMGGVQSKTYPLSGGTGSMPVTFFIRDFQDDKEVEFELSYNTQYFDAKEVERILSHFDSLFRELPNLLHQPLEAIDIVPTTEQQLLLHDFNATNVAFPQDQNFVDLFQAQVAATPENTAIVYNHQHWSYAEVNTKANRLCSYLEEQEIGAGDYVGLYMDRCPELIVSMLGILKSGAAFVPMDSSQQGERIAHMVSDAGIELMVVQSHLVANISIPALDILVLNEGEMNATWLEAYESENPAKTADPEQAAYVIYTSGSTGKPKGCGIRHRNLSNYIQWANNYYFPENTSGNFGLFTSIGFDLTLTSIVSPLSRGKSVQVFSSELEADEILRQVFDPQTTIDAVKLTPSHIGLLEGITTTNIRMVIAGGEQLLPSHCERLWAIDDRITIVNEYGPTETTVGCIASKVEPGTPISIGTPIDNTQVYILNTQSELLPIGAFGEICIAGAGVGSGYLNQAELSAKVFVQNPFAEGETMYRTGDKGRWLPDGNIELAGRVDDQIKIRGHRIEPGEIEYQLSQHDNIAEAVVMAVPQSIGNEKELIGFIVSTSTSLNTTELNTFLAEKLPVYMVPSRFSLVEKFPLTSNGKVDKQALLLQEGEALNSGVDFVAPQNPKERLLTSICQAVLGNEQLGIYDHFFYSGGDSIKAIQIKSRLHEAGYQVSLREVFDYPILKDLAQRLEAVVRVPNQESISGSIPLTPIQKEFFDWQLSEPQHFNQAAFLNLPNEIDSEGLSALFQELQNHHDALRMVFRKKDGQVEQHNQALDHPIELEWVDLKELSTEEVEAHITERTSQIQSSIQLEQGPLMKLGVFESDHQKQLLVAVHHLVIDLVSWRILAEDLATLYRQYKAEEPFQLPLKSDSYRYWSNRLIEHTETNSALKEELAYWQKTEATTVQQLPLDNEQGSQLEENTTSVSFSLNTEATTHLLSNANKAYNTNTPDLLLAAFTAALRRQFEIETLGIAMEGHGREALLNDTDTSRTVGWFTSIFPVVLNASPEGDFKNQLVLTKEQLRKVPNNGAGYNLLKWQNTENGLGKIKPQISFNFFGQFDAADQPFSLAKEAPGSLSKQNQRQYELDLTGQVKDGETSLTISFSNQRFHTSTIEQLVEIYQQQLQGLLHHCASVQEPISTPSDFTYTQLDFGQLEAIKSHFPEAIDDLYPLTPLQEGILFHELYEKGKGAYYEQMSFRLSGEVDVKLVEQAYNQLMQRHEALRAGILYKDLEQPLQVILSGRTVEFSFLDLYADTVDTSTCEDLITTYKEKDKTRGFELDTDSLMRVQVFKCAEDTFDIIWSHHHIVLDGWSTAILMQEWLSIYNTLRNRTESNLPAVKPFKNYIDWLGQHEQDNGLKYWQEYLDQYSTAVSLPGAKLSVPEHRYLNKKHRQVIDAETTAQLRKLAAQNQASLNSLMQTLWGVLVAKYNQTNDVVFGAVVSGRPPELEGTQDMVGLFINTIPVRVQFEPTDTFSNLLSNIQEESLTAVTHHYTSLSEIQQSAGQGNSLINHILIFENYPIEEQLQKVISEQGFGQDSLGFSVSGEIEFLEQTNYDFNLVFLPGKALTLEWSYNALRYDTANIEHLAAHLECAIEQVLEDATLPIELLKISDQKEQKILLEDFNTTDREHAGANTIVGLFEAQVTQTPDAVAVSFSDQTLTYQQLNEKANALANYLLNSHAPKANDIVAIMLERSEWMIVGLLGILKSGAAFLPLDPENPEDRIHYLLENSGAKLLVSEEKFLTGSKQDPARTAIDIRKVGSSTVSNPKSIPSPDHLAYVIYTSGSTGKPKGCSLLHRNLTNYINWANRSYFQDGQSGNFGLFSPLTFDLTLTSIFSPLTRGKLVHIFPPDQGIDAILHELFSSKNPVDAVKLTPAHISLLDPKALQHSTVKTAIVGGEQVLPSHTQKLWTISDQITIINEYGPTETTVGCITKTLKEGAPIAIGTPIDNTRIYIVDDQMQLLPIGVAGEICIAGAGVGNGYLNNADLTAKHFVANPFAAGEKMYRSGDLGRWTTDGDVEYIGRKDSQVKILGYRIELGEIEHCLANHNEVKEAVVLVVTGADNDKELLAAIATDTSEINTLMLRSFLQQQLPSYMIPNRFVTVKEMPLTRNGKVDKQALLELKGAETESGANYQAPQSDIEKQLVAIWAEVLDRDPSKIGVGDNFFVIGGHSLKATRIISRIHRDLGLDISLKEVFEYPTIGQLAAKLSTKKVADFIALEPIEQQDHYPVSHAQRRLWVLDQLEEQSGLYNMTTAFTLTGNLDLQALRKALTAIGQRHETLRTTFKTLDGDPVQVISETGKLTIDYLDFSKQSNAEELLAEITQKDAAAPFNLSKAPLMRAKLVKMRSAKAILLRKARFALLINMHHIIADGWSTNILARELMLFYRSFTAKEQPELSPLRVQYKDYSHWQSQLLKSEQLLPLKNYWHQQLAGELPYLQLPYEKPRPAIQSHHGAVAIYLLDAKLTKGLSELSIQMDASLFMTVTAIVKVLLYRYSGQEEIIVGTANAGREHADLEELIGFFINTLAIRSTIDPTHNFDVFVQEVKKTITAAFDHQLYPFDTLVEELVQDRDLSRNPIFDVLVTLLDTREVELSFEHVKATQQQFTTGFSKFDLTFQFSMHKEGMQLEIEYNTDLFGPTRIDQLFKHLQQLCISITEAPFTRINKLNMLTEPEKQLLLKTNNATQHNYPSGTLVQLIEQQAAEHPNNIALVFDERSLTYQELNEKANQLAHYLRKQGLESGVCAGLFLDRSLEMVIGVLAILKAGGAFVPMPTGAPGARTSYLLTDAAPKMVLLQSDYLFDLEGFEGELFAMDIQLDTLEEPVSNPAPSISENDLAYVIYTSGSTGQPKGCRISHSNVYNYIQWANGFYFQENQGGNFPLFTPLSFDLTLTSLFCTLTRGQTLTILNPNLAQDEVLQRCFAPDSKIDAVKLTPAHISMLAKMDLQTSNVKTVIAGGDQLLPEHVEALKGLNNNLEVFNEYGPTETTVGCIAAKMETGQPILIGKPIHNAQVYLLDDHAKLMPTGAVGELCIGGAGVGQGYQNKEQESASRFIENPFAPGQRLYKTGDLGRWLPDGSIEYLGRKDDQVKIRGFRIELGELEHHLLNHDKVEEAVALAVTNEQGEKELVAYLVSPDSDLNTAELRSLLGHHLPDYMLPSRFVMLAEFPLTANGKVNKKALLKLKGTEVDSGAEFQAPESDQEKLLVTIWQEVLNKEHISVADNFFYVGGDSIKAIQIASRTHEAGYQLSLRNIFESPVLKEQAALLQAVKRVPKQEEVTGPVELTPIQRTFFDWQLAHRHHFNQATLLHLPVDLDQHSVAELFDQLQQHHDALRMVFRETENGIAPYNQGIDHPVEVQAFDFSNLSQAAAQEAIEAQTLLLQSSMDLAKGPLMQLGLFDLGDKKLLLVAIHHLVIDMVSWRILAEDLATLYGQYQRKEAYVLPLKSDAYQYWAKKLAHHARHDEALAREQAYWDDQAKIQTAPLALDNPKGSNCEADGTTYSISLNAKHTDLLQSKVNQAYNTEVNDILLAALGAAFGEQLGSQQLAIAMEGHGREGILDGVDISRTVGWFTSIYPIVLNTDHAIGLPKLLIETKEMLRKVPNKGIGYDLLRHFTGTENSQQPVTIQPQVSFNFSGQFDNTINTDGPFSIAGEPKDTVNAASQRLHELDVTGHISKGQLTLSFRFSDKRFQTETIENLAKACQHNLVNLIEHCSQLPATVFTPSDYSYSKLSNEQLLALNAQFPSNIEDLYPLTLSQEGMLFHALYEEDKGAYFEQMNYRLQGEVNPQFVARAFNEILMRHEALRAAFVYKGLEQPVQVILKNRKVAVEYQDFFAAGMALEESEKAIFDSKEADKDRGFELDSETLMRVSVFRFAADQYEISWSHHHILFDGWSLGIIMKDWFAVYQKLNSNASLLLPEAKPFKEYIKWTQHQQQDDSLAFWAARLENYAASPSIPGSRTKGKPEAHENKKHRIEFSESFTQQLQDLAANNQASLSTVMQTLWGILLAKYNGLSDVVYGAVVSGRPPQLEHAGEMVGLFINTVPVRVRFENDQAFSEVLKTVQSQSLEATSHHYSSLSEIQQVAGLDQDLVDHIMVFENFPVEEQLLTALSGEEAIQETFPFSFTGEVDISEHSNYDFSTLCCFPARP